MSDLAVEQSRLQVAEAGLDWSCMAIPTDINARRYYRVAFQRLDDGNALIAIMRPRAAIYLTGYAVECILKALLLVTLRLVNVPMFSIPFGARARIISMGCEIDWSSAPAPCP